MYKFDKPGFHSLVDEKTLFPTCYCQLVAGGINKTSHRYCCSVFNLLKVKHFIWFHEISGNVKAFQESGIVVLLCFQQRAPSVDIVLVSQCIEKSLRSGLSCDLCFCSLKLLYQLTVWVCSQILFDPQQFQTTMSCALMI